MGLDELRPACRGDAYAPGPPLPICNRPDLDLKGLDVGGNPKPRRLTCPQLAHHIASDGIATDRAGQPSRRSPPGPRPEGSRRWKVPSLAVRRAQGELNSGRKAEQG